jgi:hypothetical protein
MRKLAWVLLGLCLAAEHAMAEGRWVKDGVTQEEKARDDAACLKESQRMVNVPPPVGQTGVQAGSSTVARQKTEPDIALYRACAHARGYVWVKS